MSKPHHIHNHAEFLAGTRCESSHCSIVEILCKPPVPQTAGSYSWQYCSNPFCPNHRYELVPSKKMHASFVESVQLEKDNV